MNIGKITNASRRVSLFFVAAVLAFSALVATSASVGAKGFDPCEDGIPNAYWLADAYTAVGSLTTTLSGSYSAACDTPIVDYSWDFGDGTTANGLEVTHTFGIGTWSPVLTITDEEGLTNSFTHTQGLIVKESNLDPVFDDQSYTTTPSNSIEVSLVGSDPDGDALSYSALGDGITDLGSYYGSNGTYTYYPSTVGTDTLFVEVTDGFGGSDVVTVTIDVLQIIVAVADSAETDEDTPVVIDVVTNDFTNDGSGLELYWTQFVSDNGGSLSFDASTGTVTYTPAFGFFGVDMFEYGVVSTTPGTWNPDTAVVTVTVNEVLPPPPPPNQAPVANPDFVTVDEDGGASFLPVTNDTDADGDPLTLSLAGQPQNGTASLAADNRVIYIPNANFFGGDSISYYVTDDQGNVSNETTITVTVNSVNDLPVAGNDSAILSEDESVTVDVLSNDSDLESNDLSVTILVAPTDGSADVNSDGSITYSPNSNFNGVDRLTYQISDEDGGTATATVVFTVTSVNDAPEADLTASYQGKGKKKGYLFDASGSSDVDGQIVSYTFDFDDGQTHTTQSSSVNHKYQGKSTSRTVTVTVTDNEGATATASIQI